MSNELDQIASHGSGDVVVFKLIEFLRDHALPETSHDFQSDTFAPRDSYEIDDNGGDDDGCEADAPDANSLSISNELAPPQVHEKWTACIVSGEILVDRKSTFQAHLAPVQSANDVAELLLVLKSNNKIARATHNIMAYRIVRKEGEKLESLLIVRVVSPLADAFILSEMHRGFGAVQEASSPTATTTGNQRRGVGSCTSSAFSMSAMYASSSQGMCYPYLFPPT